MENCVLSILLLYTVQYGDATGWRVTLSIAGGDLLLVGEGIDRRVPFSSLRVDERLGRAPRRLRFDDGTFCEVRDLGALDALLEAGGHIDGWVDRVQRRAQFVLIAILASLLLAFAAYRWGLPSAAAMGAKHLPSAVSTSLSVQTLKVLDGGMLNASHVSSTRQQSLKAQFYRLRLPERGHPASTLLFRAAPTLGANAFTLPDGTIIVNDDLVTTMSEDGMVLAVLSHELGHAHGRHGLQLLLRSSAIGAFLTFYVGDVSMLLAVAPATVLQARYSRDLEQQADDYGAAVMSDNGMSPALLADALKILSASHPGSSADGYMASHPATDARMRHLRVLAGSSAESVKE